MNPGMAGTVDAYELRRLNDGYLLLQLFSGRTAAGLVCDHDARGRAADRGGAGVDSGFGDFVGGGHGQREAVAVVRVVCDAQGGRGGGVVGDGRESRGRVAVFFRSGLYGRDFAGVAGGGAVCLGRVAGAAGVAAAATAGGVVAGCGRGRGGDGGLAGPGAGACGAGVRRGRFDSGVVDPGVTGVAARGVRAGHRQPDARGGRTHRVARAGMSGVGVLRTVPGVDAEHGALFH